MFGYIYNMLSHITNNLDITNIINTNISNYNIEFDKFENILEYIPSIMKKIKEQNILDEELMVTIARFCKKINKDKFIVSLSGGVDSMVLITILHWLDYNVVGAHINYNNRDETVLEQQFIEEWCKYNDIPLYVKVINDIKRDTTKRAEYESITRNIRLDFYKEIMNRENTEYVLLGHHKDDIIENIFANMCRGRNYLDLAVIRQQAVISNINIGRPMIQYYKNVIYDFAHKYQVPYFKDTTPKWSVRGKYREIISPAIEDAFTKNVKENLLNISRQADEWNSLLEFEIINPFIESIKFYEEYNKIVEVNIEKYIDYPLAFWTIVLMKIFNHFGYKSPSKKSIQTFMTTIKYCNEKHKNNYNIILSNNAKCTILNNNIIVIFK